MIIILGAGNKKDLSFTCLYKEKLSNIYSKVFGATLYD